MERSASRGLTPAVLADLLGERGHGDLVDLVGAEAAVGQGVGGVAGLGQVALVEGVDVDDEGAALGRTPRLAFRAAGFMATSTLGASPGVRMSWSEMWTWKADTPARVPAGARISAGKSGKVDRSLPNRALEGGEAVPGQLHAVAGVTGEADDHPVELLWSHARSPACHRRPHLVVVA